MLRLQKISSRWQFSETLGGGQGRPWIIFLEPKHGIAFTPSLEYHTSGTTPDGLPHYWYHSGRFAIDKENLQISVDLPALNLALGTQETHRFIYEEVCAVSLTRAQSSCCSRLCFWAAR
jgi:hypothetical protein